MVQAAAWAADSGKPELPPPEVLARFDISDPRDLGGRVNHQWAVSRRDRSLVLRRVPASAIGDLAYELRLLDQLSARGWPVAAAIEPPESIAGAQWCLFPALSGTPRAENDESDLRARGHLLATLHEDLEQLAGLGQRGGWTEVADVVLDSGLVDELRGFERQFPEEGRIMRWHAERARDLLGQAAVELADSRRVVLHGDFAPWNLLYDDGSLAGILDWEAAHLDVAVADFALSWRGKYDGVIRGYEEVRPLTDGERMLLTPIFCSWLFLGLQEDLRAIKAGAAEPTLPEWSIRQLLRRSPMMGLEAVPYPGR